MSPYILCLMLWGGSYIHPQSDKAIADYTQSGFTQPAYLSLDECPKELQPSLQKSLQFVVPSLSSKSFLGNQIPQRVPNSNLLRLDLEGLGWEKTWPDVATLYAKTYRPDIPAGSPPPIVVSGLWFLAVVTDPNQSGDLQYRLIYNGVAPKTLDEARQFWKINTEPAYSFGFLEGDSKVKADDADKTRQIVNFPGAQRIEDWTTVDSVRAAGAKDPLENLLARPAKGDAGETIFVLPKYKNGKYGLLQNYFLSNAKGERQEKAPANLVVDETGIRGIEIKNTISCIACHDEGLKVPTLDLYRGYIENGSRIGVYKKADQEEIDRFFQSPIVKAIETVNEGFTVGVQLCNGLTPVENSKIFIQLVQTYDRPLTLADVSRELYTSPKEFQNALGLYSKQYGLTGRLALLVGRKPQPIPRSAWEENFHLAQKVLLTWRDSLSSP